MSPIETNAARRSGRRIIYQLVYHTFIDSTSPSHNEPTQRNAKECEVSGAGRSNVHKMTKPVTLVRLPSNNNGNKRMYYATLGTDTMVTLGEAAAYGIDRNQ